MSVQVAFICPWTRAPGRPGARTGTDRVGWERFADRPDSATVTPSFASSPWIRLTDLSPLMRPAFVSDLFASRSFSEAGAERGSPLLKRGQLGPEALDLAIDPCQLGPGLPSVNVTVAVG